MGNSTANGRNWKKRALACLLAFSMVAQQGGVTFAGETDPAVVAAAEQEAAAAAQAESERIAREQAEAEAKAKAEAEAKAKAEEEARIKAEEEARAKAEAEEKARQESEAKAKAEAEAKAKAEAEAKAKAESEAKAKAESEAAAKAKEESEKAAAESEKKAKEESEKAANAESSTEAASTESQNTPSETKPETEIQSESQEETEIQSETSDAHDADTETTVSETQMSETETAVSESETESETETEEEFKSGILRESGNGYQITLTYDETARIPEEARIVSREIVQGTAEYEALLAQAHARMGITDAVDKAVTQARFFDITIVDKKGRTLEPESGVTVEITYSKPVEVENANDIDMVHFAEDGAEILDVEATKVNQNGDIKKIEFEADSFSTYGLIYTVDFTYKDGYTYQMPGGEQMLLSELFDALDIDESTANVIEVVFTDDSLLTVEKTDDDYVLKSLKPFASEETLTVTVNDPATSEVVKYVIDVTDEQGEVALTELASAINASLDSSSSETDLARNATVDLNIAYQIDDAKLDTAKRAEYWVYDLSTFISENPVLNLADMADGVIMDGKIIAGSYEIKDNKVYLRVDPNWLAKKNSGVQGTFSLSVGFDAEKVKTRDDYIFQFPGASEGPHITFKEVNVAHEKTVDGNSWNNVVTVTKDADGNYKLHYRLKVNSDSYLDNLSVTDVLTGSQKLVVDSIKVVVNNGGTSFTNIELTASSDKGFTLDMLKSLQKNGTTFTPGTDYFVEYDVTIPADKIGKVGSDGNPTAVSEAEGNSATWNWGGTSTPDVTEVYTKTKKEVCKSVEESKNADGKTVLNYTITIGDADTDFAGHTISDRMINLQDLNNTVIAITNTSGFSANANITWTKPAEYKNEEVPVFNYVFSDDDHVTGPLTITYSTTVKDSDEVAAGIKGNLWVGNKVTDEYPEGEKPESSAGVSKPYGDDTSEEKVASIAKEGVIDSDHGKKLIHWTITVTPEEGVALPLRNVDIGETQTNYGFGTNAINDYARSYPLQVLPESFIITDGTRTLINGTDYSIVEPGAAPYYDGNTYHLVVNEMNGPLTVTVDTYVPNGFENEANEVFYAGNKANVTIPGAKSDEAKALVMYSNNKHTFTKTGEYEESTGLFKWTVVINASKNFITPDYAPGFRDTIPDGMEFVTALVNDGLPTNTIKVNANGKYTDWNDYYVSVNVSGQTISASDITKGRYTYGEADHTGFGLDGTQYTITYYTKLTNTELSRIEGSSDTYAYTNQAEEMDKDGTTVAKDTDTVTYKYTAVTKEDLSDEQLAADLIEYKVVANPDHIQLNGGHNMALWDRIPTNVELVTNSVVVEGTSDYKVGYNDDSRRLSFTIPDATTVTITFKVRVKELTGAGVKETFSNSVVLQGGGTYEDTVDKEHVVIKHSSTISGEDNTIDLRKIDEYNITQPLEGAQFELHKLDYNPTTYEITKNTPVKIYETNSEGKITFQNVAYKTLYYWIEIKASEGYLLPTTNREHYFIMYKNGDQAMRQEVWELDDKIQAANNITVKSIEEHDEWTATNVKDSDYTVPLTAEKTLTGRTLNDGEFTFTVTPGGNYSEELVDASGLVSPVTNKGEQVDFGALKIKGKGTFTFTVKETREALGGIHYDETEYTVTIVTNYNDKGDLEGITSITTKNGNAVDKMTFANDYTASGELTFDGQKIIEGRNFVDGDKLTVKISSTDGGRLPSPATQTITPAAGQSTCDFSFNKVQYTLDDLKDASGKQLTEKSFHYTISETNVSMSGTSPVNAEDTITVTVKDKGDGTLEVSKVAANGGENGRATLKNKYDATGFFVPEGKKTITGRAFTTGDSLTVTIAADTSKNEVAPLPRSTEKSVTLIEGATSASFKFDKITYNLADLGDATEKTFYYTLTETFQGGNGVTNDTATHTLEVTVKKDKGDGTLSVTGVYKKGKEVETMTTFANTYNATGSFTPVGVKTLQGRNFKSGDTLNVQLLGETGTKLQEKTVTVDSAKNTADFEFKPITYALADLDGADNKVFHYTVTENFTPAGGSTVINDAATHTIDVTVTDKKDGTLDVKPVYSDGEKVRFTNTAIGSLSVKKTVAGNAADKTKSFAFRVTLTGEPALTGTYGGMVFTNNVADFTLKDGETATATGLPTGYSYTVSETDYSGAGYVTNKTGDTGTIEADVEKKAEFTNTRDKTGGMTIEKIIKGNAASADDIFYFKVTLTNPTDEVENGTFSEVKFTNGVSELIQLKGGESKTIEGLPNGQAYTVEEVNENGSVLTDSKTMSGYTANPVLASGTVSETGAATHTFTNTKESYADLKISKTVGGNAPEVDKIFQFSIWLKNGDKPVSDTYTAVGIANGQTVTSVTFDSTGKAEIMLKNGEQVTIKNLPNGVTYTVTETAVEGYATTVESTDPSKTDDEQKSITTGLTVSKTITGGENYVYQEDYTNNRDIFGDIKIQKKITGNVSTTDKDFYFKVKLGDTNFSGTADVHGVAFVNGVARFSLKAGQTQLIKHLPNGMNYTVTEVAGPNSDEVASPPPVSIRIGTENVTTAQTVDGTKTGDKAPIVVVTNEVNEYGGLSVEKVKNGGDYNTFHAKVYVYPTGEWNYKGDSSEISFRKTDMAPSLADPTQLNATAYVAELTFNGSEVKTIERLDVGLPYYIVETEANTNNYITSYTGQKGTIVGTTDSKPSDDNKAVVTNTKKTGSLIVTKQVAGNQASETDTFPITVTFSKESAGSKYTITGQAEKTFTGTTVTVNLSNGQSATFKDIEADTTYTVTEDLTNNKYKGYVSTIEYPETGDIHTINADSPQSVTVTNTRNGYGALKVEKRVGGNDADKKTWFAMKVTLSDRTFNGTVKASVGERVFDLPFVNGVSSPTVGDAKWVLPDKKSSVPAGFIAITKTQPLCVYGLPAGVTYTVEEDDYSKTYDSKTIVYGDNKNLTSGTIASQVNSATAKISDYGEIPTEAVTVVTNVRNRYAKLAIIKMLDGNDVSETDEFTFTITTDPKVPDGTYSGVTFTGGQAEVTMTGKVSTVEKATWNALEENGGIRVLIDGLPLNTRFTVTELSNNKNYELSYTGLMYQEKQEGSEKKITVVHDGESGASSISGTTNVDQRVAVFRNTRNTYGNLQISKTVAGNAVDNNKAFEINVELEGLEAGREYAVEPTGIVTNNKLTADNNGKANTTFALKHGQTLTIKELPNATRYTVTETDYSTAGYTTTVNGASGREAIGTIVGNVEKTAVTTAAFTNTRDAEGSLKLIKKLAGNTPETGITFTLALDTVPALNKTCTYTVGNDTTKHDLAFTSGHAEVDIQGGQGITVNGLPNGTEVTVTEFGGKPSNHDKTTFVVTGSDMPSEEKGVVTISETAAVMVEITNTRDTEGSLILSKKVEGDDADKTKLFTFNITLKDVENHPICKTFDAVGVADLSKVAFNDKGEATVTLKHSDTLTIKGLPNGAKYTVVETEATGYTTKVNGSPTDTRDVSGTIQGETSVEAVFVNTYVPTTATVFIPVKKTVSNGEWPTNETFTFNISALTSGAPMPSDTSLTVNKNETVKTFGQISYAKSGEYRYQITEQKGDNLDVYYNTTPVVITVVVSNNPETGALTAEVKHGNTVVTENAPIIINNIIGAQGEFIPHGVKELSGRNFKNGDTLSVSIASNNGGPLPKDEQGNIVATITVPLEYGQSTAEFSFNPIVFQKSDLGGAATKTFAYTVTETANMAGTTNDINAHTISVKVDDNGDGTLTVTPNYSNGNPETDMVKFVNEYNAKGTLTIHGKKTLVNRVFDLNDNLTVALDVKSTNPNAPMPTIRTKQVELTKGKNTATFEFGPIEYKLSDLGGKTSATFTYVMTENAAMESTTVDKREHTVDVTVSDNGSGTLIVVPVYKVDGEDSDKNITEFVNTYEYVTVEGTKTWADGANPCDIVVELYKTVNSVTSRVSRLVLEAENRTDWSYSFGNQPKYASVEGSDELVEIEYDVREVKMTAFSTKVEKDENSEENKLIFNITNTPVVEPTFEKKIKDVNDSTNVRSDWQDSADYDIGDEVPYKLTATLANNVTDYKKYNIKFSDNMDPGLTFQRIESVRVNGSSKAYTLESSEHSFELALSWGDDTELITDTSLNSATVEVLFSAKLNENAVIGSAGNINRAKMTYSNISGFNADGTPIVTEKPTDEDGVIVFTYKMEAAKVNKAGEALKGAEFQLWKKIAGQDNKLVETIENLTDNTFSFVGLDDGDYILIETKVPRAGLKFIEPVEFTITANHQDNREWNLNESTPLIELNGDLTSGAITLPGDNGNSIVNYEAEQPDFKKKVMDVNDSTGEASGWQDSADYDIGDDVPFQLSATLADNVTDYYKYNIQFHDVMEKSLTFQRIESVKVNGKDLPAANYKLTKTSDQEFILDLNWEGAGDAKIADASLNKASVEVVFYATLNENAVLGKQGNVNRAEFSYSNNPNLKKGEKEGPDDRGSKPWDSVIVFTYKTVISKVDPSGKALTGAKFRLEKVTADGTTMVGTYTAATDNNSFTFTGLDDGNYVLTETKTPAGYKTIAPIAFTVEAAHSQRWEGEERTTILTALTGNATSGALDLKANEALESLTGNVVNESSRIPDFAKKVMDVNDSTGEASGWQDSADYDIGDDVPFQLSATLADNVTDYYKYNIQFHDVMEKSLTFQRVDSVKVNGKDLPAANYKLTKTSDQEFTLDLNWEGAGDARIADASLNKANVEVVFYAKLNENAVLGKQGNVNQAEFSYSNNPNLKKGEEEKPGDRGSKPWDAVIVFTYQTVINKVDASGAALAGAEFKLEKALKSGGTETISRVTVADGTKFTFTGLDDGVYTLTETKTPAGFSTIAPITFTVSATHNEVWEGTDRTKVLTALTGDVTSGALSLSADADLKTLTGNVKNDKQTGNGSIEVTKYTLKKNRSFKVSNETYYTALFSDAALTNRVSDVKPLVLRNSYTTSVTFTNLAFGIYYVGETNASGTPVSTAANTSKVEIENGMVTLSGASPTGSSVIKNTVPEGVLGAYADVRLKISKKVQNTSGDAMNVNDTFYFALYSDAACTKRVKGVDIVSVKLNGTSSGSASFRDLPYSSAFYVAEVDKNGKKVESSNSFGYKVKVAGDGLTYKAVNGATVTVTNKRKKGKPAGANRENGTQGAQGQQAAVRTGDTTPIMPMLITMITAGLAALYLAIRRKRRA